MKKSPRIIGISHKVLDFFGNLGRRINILQKDIKAGGGGADIKQLLRRSNVGEKINIIVLRHSRLVHSGNHKRDDLRLTHFVVTTGQAENCDRIPAMGMQFYKQLFPDSACRDLALCAMEIVSALNDIILGRRNVMCRLNSFNKNAFNLAAKAYHSFFCNKRTNGLNFVY